MMTLHEKIVLGLSLLILFGFGLVAIGTEFNNLSISMYGVMFIFIPAILASLYSRMRNAASGWVPPSHRQTYDEEPHQYEVHHYYHGAPKVHYKPQNRYRQSDLLDANLRDIDNFRKKSRKPPRWF
jgi:hypothetical protein